MAIKIPFKLEHNFEYAKLEKLTPLIRRVTARNPSGFTFHGTGTYIIGRKDVAIIDPGPLLEEHIQALKRLLSGENITHILITHTHMDHSPAAAPLKDFWGVKTFGFGPHGGRIGNSQNTEAGGDNDFIPDKECKDGTISALMIGLSNAFILLGTHLIIFALLCARKIRCLLGTTSWGGQQA